ncbi:MAG: CDP-alcohol phosphatidyltransferase family protein [Oscillospiraceae bacterium]|nr:CDP-alcohol phosphatidyltransferase family protein [Oscillospiraceae bacterium]
MHRVFQKEQILTIPNLLSLVRIGLIPVIIWLYCVKKEYTLAVAVIFLSGVTDIVDGWFARHFNMVSDFGKILDPLADKLTQATMIICLTVKYKLMYGIIGLFAFKEILMSTLGLLVIRKRDAVNSAKWHGKVNTVILYTVMMLLILFPGLPKPLANI